MSPDVPDQVKEMLALAARLENSPRVQRVARLRASASVKEIATEVADGLIDIRESARVLFTDCLPRLQSASPGSEEFEDALNDIGEEYRHIYYHIVHTQMFAYVIVPQE